MEKYAPILLIGYNRPKMLKESLEYLVSIDAKLYVALDIPKPDDSINCELSKECQKIVGEFAGQIADIRISDQNQGCFKGVTAAITWAFTHEEAIIILEDDVRIDEKFLAFSTQMLGKYMSEDRIGSVAATNLVPMHAISDPDSAYRLSAFTSSWGWATWRNRWEDYLDDLETFPYFDHTFPEGFWSFLSKRYWDRVFLETLSGRFDAWDYRWLYSNWKNSRLTIVPNSNLALNVGFGADATHTKDLISPWWLPTEISKEFLPKNGLKNLNRDVLADLWMSHNHFRNKLAHQVRGAITTAFPRVSGYYHKILKRN